MPIDDRRIRVIIAIIHPFVDALKRYQTWAEARGFAVHGNWVPGPLSDMYDAFATVLHSFKQIGLDPGNWTMRTGGCGSPSSEVVSIVRAISDSPDIGLLGENGDRVCPSRAPDLAALIGGLEYDLRSLLEHLGVAPATAHLEITLDHENHSASRDPHGSLPFHSAHSDSSVLWVLFVRLVESGEQEATRADLRAVLKEADVPSMSDRALSQNIFRLRKLIGRLQLDVSRPPKGGGWKLLSLDG